MHKPAEHIEESARIAGQYVGVFDSPPIDIPSMHTPGGPMLGNGDLGVVIGGNAEALTFYLSKNEFWSIERGAVVPVGRMALSIPALAGASYHMEQDILLAEVRGHFKVDLADFRNESVELRMRTWLHATENILVTEISNTGSYETGISMRFLDPLGLPCPLKNGEEGETIWQRFASDPDRPWERPQIRFGDKPFLKDMQVFPGALSLEEIAKLAPTGQICPSEIPNTPFTIAAWIDFDSSKEENTIISTGEWDSAVNFAVMRGKLKLGTHGVYVESEETVPDGASVVAAVFDGVQIRIYINGIECSGSPKLAKEPQEADIWGPNPFYGCVWRGSGPPSGSGPRAVAAARVVGTESTHAESSLSFKLAPGKSATLVCTVLSETDHTDFEAEAVHIANETTYKQIQQLNESHRTWWREFYGKSFIEIPDKTIEKHWYASLYLFACCNRGNEPAPGLWGNWITHPYMWWHGDYTLNYNYQSPFWGAFSSNHLELVECYDKPLLDWLPRGKAYARLNGYPGVFYLTHIGPLPGGSSDLATHGQKYQTLFSVINCLLRRKYECDPAYTRKVYPLLLETAKFWQSYLVFGDGRYVDKGDSAFECVDSGDVNPVAQLGMLKMFFTSMLEIGAELGADLELQEKWRHIADHLSELPVADAYGLETIDQNGKRVPLREALGDEETRGVMVHRMTEKGFGWNLVNAVGLQHIFPPDLIGLESDQETLQVARNTIHLHGLSENRWCDGNGTPTLYPAAARVGYNPELILSKLHMFLETCSYPNLHPFVMGGGVECLSVVPSCLGEMLCQSHQNVIHVFANWPRNMDAKFGSLRAYGAFLVSSQMSDGNIKYVRIQSENGGTCTLKNPWPECSVRMQRNGTESVQDDKYLSFETQPGDVWLITAV